MTVLVNWKIFLLQNLVLDNKIWSKKKLTKILQREAIWTCKDYTCICLLNKAICFKNSIFVKLCDGVFKNKH